MIRPPDPHNGAGEFVIPSRERLAVGEQVTVEVSFGPLADEIFVDGIVTTITPREEGTAPLVTVHVLEADLLRMRYMMDVLEGRRQATARRFRRVDAGMDVRWWWGIKAQSRRARGISFGGTFIHADETPKVGFRTEVEIRTDSRQAPLRIPSHVVWAGDGGHGHGFGVQFHVEHSEVADRLRALIKHYERGSTKEIVSLLRR